MSYCPNCHTALSDNALFCIKCGLRMDEGIDLAKGKPESVELVCQCCGEGNLILVSSQERSPLHRCDKCDYYFGDLLRRGTILYYNTTQLKVAQYVSVKLDQDGEMTLERGEADDDTRILGEAIAAELEMEPGKAVGALAYLLQNGVLVKYEEERFGEPYLGLRFKEAVEDEITV